MAKGVRGEISAFPLRVVFSGGNGVTGIGRLRRGGLDRCVNRLGIILFTPRSLGLIGNTPTGQEGFLSVRLNRVGPICLRSLIRCRQVLGRQGLCLGRLIANGTGSRICLSILARRLTVLNTSLLICHLRFVGGLRT